MRQSEPGEQQFIWVFSPDPSLLNARGQKVKYTLLLGKQDWNIFMEGQKSRNTVVFHVLSCDDKFVTLFKCMIGKRHLTISFIKTCILCILL